MYQQLAIDPDGGERLNYIAPDFPVRCVDGNLYYFHDFSAGCHWHNAFELLIANQGDIEYFVNGKTVSIPQGQGIFVNANRLHYGFSSRQEDCCYSVLVFHPDIFGSPAMPMSRHVRAITADPCPDYLLLSGSDIPQRVQSIQSALAQQQPRYELEVLAQCCAIMQLVCPLMEAECSPAEPDGDWLAIRQMIGFLQTHYAQPIRLEEIAAAGAVCRSKCCRLFQEKLDTTPIAYLNRYRMEKAREQLLSSRLPITQIAHQCGFDSPSYFSELFRKTYGDSPRALRRSQ